MEFGSGYTGIRTCLCVLSADIAAYYVLVMRLSAVYVMLSTELLLVVIDLAYDLFFKYWKLRISDRCTNNKQ